MKYLALTVLMALLAFTARAQNVAGGAPVFGVGTSGGGTGGSATNVFLGGAEPGLVITNGTGNWTITGKVSTGVSNWVTSLSGGSTWPGGPEVWINPPQVGPTKGTDGYAVTALNSRFVFLPDSGIARTVFIHADFGDQNNFLTNAQNINFQMFHNVGSTTNPPASSNLCVNIPMSELMMNQHRFTSNNPYSLRIDSEFLHVVDQSTNSNYGGYIKEVVLLFPMAWTNGAVFRLTNTLYGSNYAGGYISIRYDVGTPVGPYAHWRLQNKRYSGSISATVSNHLFSVNSSAVIVGFQNSLLGTFGGNQIVNFQDSHAIRIQTQGTTAYEGSGGDDLYLNTYGGAPGLHENRLVGTVNIVRDSSISTPEQLIPLAMEQYRWFTRDAINCTSNFVANINGAFSDLSSFKFNCWYYAPMP